MPQGLSKVSQIAKDNAARRVAFEKNKGGARWFSPKTGEVHKVRFLEQGEEVWFFYVHDLPSRSSQQFPDQTPCLDQDDDGNTACPACERGISRRSIVLINIIWFGAPKFKRDKDNKLVRDSFRRPVQNGNEDTVALWRTSATTGGLLEHLDSRYHGLTSWIFEIRREGSGRDTKYFIDPVDPTAGPTEPSSAERELAKKKSNPAELMQPLSSSEMNSAYSGSGSTPADDAQGSLQPNGGVTDGPGNVFEEAEKSNIKRGAFGG